MTITTRQATLMRRMAWNERRMREPTIEDKKLVPIAIKLLSYIACLNYALCDLEDEMRDAGKYRHETKRRIQQAQKMVEDVHNTAYYMLYNSNHIAGRQYNDATDGSWREISEAVLLPPPERAYNIVVALCRLVEKKNIQLSGKYDFTPAKKLYTIPALLACCGIEDRKIDVIIEKNVS